MPNNTFSPNINLANGTGGLFDDNGNLIQSFLNKAQSVQGFDKTDPSSLPTIADSQGNNKQPPFGFVPPGAFYVNSKLIDSRTGLPQEYGYLYTPNSNNVVYELTDGSGNVSVNNLFGSHSFVNPNNVDPISGSPIEAGRFPYDVNNIGNKTTDNVNNDNQLDYDSLNDLSGKQFKYLMDYFNGSAYNSIGNQRDIPIPNNYGDSGLYLGSFLRTIDENEDPTMLGYDITIDIDNSPLFITGSASEIENFIKTYGGFNNTEISSRLKLLNEFRKQFYKFFKTFNNASNFSEHVTPSGTSNGAKTTGPKVYYLRKITGLNKLVESNDSDKINSFIEYGKDFIGLTFHEDVAQSIGYLASLYKTLSWSRINGKQIIPENLLRFDAILTITEVRNYNRVFADPNNVNNLADFPDLISKYVYNLYECQFFFQSLPHTDELDMSEIRRADSYGMKFNYKYSDMQFYKFYNYAVKNGTMTTTVNLLDNGNTTAFYKGFSGTPYPTTSAQYKTYNNSSKVAALNASAAKNSNITPQRILPTLPPLPTPTRVSPFAQATNQLLNNVKLAAAKEVNTILISQAALLNKALEDIRNSLGAPLFNRMSQPTNVYQNTSAFQNQLINAARQFVGSSIKGFFTPPSE